MNITGILLAAGSSARFGSDKLLYRLQDDGETIIERSAHNLAAVTDNLVIISDPHNHALTQHLNTLHYRRVDNPHARLGMGTTIACGVKATEQADAWIIALGDMPFVKPQSIEKISQALAAGNKIVAPFYHGQRGHPVGFNKDYYEPLSLLDTDSGARYIIKDNQNDLIPIEIDDPGICMDIDCRSDLKNIHHFR